MRPSPFVYCCLFSALFSVIFNYTLSIMASPYIAGDLGASNDIATYTVSFFALGNALGVPLGRPLMHRIGAARFVGIILFLFTLTSWLCAIAPTYAFFNVARFLQGWGSGALYALFFYWMGKLQPPEKKDIFGSITLTLFTIGPVLGACFGGFLAYIWSWRICFYCNIPILLFLSLYLSTRLKTWATKEDAPSFDGLGYFFYAVGLSCVGTGLIMGQELDWLRSNLICTLLIVGSLLLLFFIFWECTCKSPLLEIKLLKNPILFFALFNLAVLFSAYFGMIILLSLWLKLWVNYTPIWIAALLGIMALTGLFPVFLIDRRLARIDNRIFLALAIIFMAISCFHTMIFNVEIDLPRIATSRFFAGLGLAFFLAPIFRLSFHSVSPEKNIHVLGLFQITRALSSGLGASLYATLWLRRQVFFHERLGSSLTAFSEQTLTFFHKAYNLGLQGEHASAQLEYFLQRQATALALDDCFFLMAWTLVALLITFILTFFTKSSSFVTVTK